jgi:hypothetical protein
MRRLVLATIAVGLAAGTALPALAKPPVPVGVGGNGNGGVCVYAFDWVPQCVDTGQVGAAVGGHTNAAPQAVGIFCPYFQNPTVQAVAHAVCTRSRQA